MAEMEIKDGNILKWKKYIIIVIFILYNFRASEISYQVTGRIHLLPPHFARSCLAASTVSWRETCTMKSEIPPLSLSPPCIALTTTRSSIWVHFQAAARSWSKRNWLMNACTEIWTHMLLLVVFCAMPCSFAHSLAAMGSTQPDSAAAHWVCESELNVRIICEACKAWLKMTKKNF